MGAIVLLLTATMVFLFTGRTADANPESFQIKSFNDMGTTTATGLVNGAFMTQGTGTTTLGVLDAYKDTNVAISNTAQLALMLVGSTSPFVNTNYATTTYRIDFEYSQDGIDWFRPAATSSVSTAVGPNGFFIQLGATTIAGVPISTTTPTYRIIEVSTPTRFVRPVISLPFFGTIVPNSNGAVWGQWIAKKQLR